MGSKYFAFQDKSKDHLRQGVLFMLVEAWTILLNIVGFHLLVTLTPIRYYLVRPLVTLTVYCGFSYPLWKKVFRP